jgi:hypothetical protein
MEVSHIDEADNEKSGRVPERLPDPGIDIETLARRFGDEEVGKFCGLFDKLIKALVQRSPPHLTGEL